MSSILKTLKKYGDIVLIGIIPIRIVKDQTDNFGNTAVGHSTGSGVRLFQMLSSPPPERVQLNCTFLGQSKFALKTALELLFRTKIPFPFVSSLTVVPLVTIKQLSFRMSSERKDVKTTGPAIDFTITLEEFKLSSILTIIAKALWLTWTTVTHPDKGTGLKLYSTPPEGGDQSAIIPTEYMYANAIDDIDQEDYDYDWTATEWNAANILNSKFDKLPINPAGIFPQVIKLQYPPSSSHYSSFNDVNNLPTEYIRDNIFYKFPSTQPQDKQLIIKILPKQTLFGTTITMIVKIVGGEIIFERKIVTKKVYDIGIYQFTFNEISIKKQNINPENRRGGDFGSKFIGGIRLK